MSSCQIGWKIFRTRREEEEIHQRKKKNEGEMTMTIGER